MTPGGARSSRLPLAALTLLALSCCGRRRGGGVAGEEGAAEGLVERCRRECAARRSSVACGRYGAVRLVDGLVRQKEFAYGPFKIIEIPAIQSERLLPELPAAAVRRGGALAETLRFVREAAEELLTRRALVYTVESSPGARGLGDGGAGIMVLDDEELGRVRRSRSFQSSMGTFRIFKKKKNIILPILILLNLIKLKLLILPIFLGVHFIKKLLVLGSLLLPSILSHLKICKMVQQPFHYHPWAAPVEYPVDYPSAYGHEDAWDHRNDVVGGNAYANYYSHNMYNPFAHYFQNYNKQSR